MAIVRPLPHEFRDLPEPRDLDRVGFLQIYRDAGAKMAQGKIPAVGESGRPRNGTGGMKPDAPALAPKGGSAKRAPPIATDAAQCALRRRAPSRGQGYCAVRSFAGPLLRPRELPEQPLRRRHIGRMRGFGGRIPAEMVPLPILVQPGNPPSRPPILMDALEPGRVVPMAWPIGAVGRSVRAAQVVPAVVRAVEVAVVNHRVAPCAGHVQPCELMGHVTASADTDLPISGRLVQTPGNAAHLNRVAYALPPAKFPGIRIVVQNLAQPRLGQALAACHWRLAKNKGPQSGPSLGPGTFDQAVGTSAGGLVAIAGGLGASLVAAFAGCWEGSWRVAASRKRAYI
jgi:hypothetical protein